jgi:hypothetical protein
MRLRITILIGALLLCFGCAERGQRFTGSIEFKNYSDTEIWVDTISGAPGILACGSLNGSGSGGKTVLGASVRLPAQIAITWSEGSESYTNRQRKMYTNSLSLSLPAPPQLTGILQLEFTSNKVWRAAFENPGH